MSVQRYIILLFPAIRQNWLLTVYRLARGVSHKMYYHAKTLGYGVKPLLLKGSPSGDGTYMVLNKKIIIQIELSNYPILCLGKDGKQILTHSSIISRLVPRSDFSSSINSLSDIPSLPQIP